jgi:hypothetical protein
MRYKSTTSSFVAIDAQRELSNVRQEPKANTNAAYKICDLAYKILKV